MNGSLNENSWQIQGKWKFMIFCSHNFDIHIEIYDTERETRNMKKLLKGENAKGKE